MTNLNDNPFISSLCSYIVGPENIGNDTKQFKFVMTNTGVKKVIKNKIGTFVTDTKEVPGLGKLDTGVVLSVPKIPAKLLTSMVDFFKKVMVDKHGAEAMLQFFYDPATGTYKAYCPKQTVSGASVRYESNEEMESKYILVLECHSHNTMGAFFSGVDDADEKRTMIFGVFGRLDRPVYEYRFRASIAGEYHAIAIDDIFDIPKPAEDSFPKEWLDNCAVASRATEYTRGSYSGFYPPYGGFNQPHAEWKWSDEARAMVRVPITHQTSIFDKDNDKDDDNDNDDKGYYTDDVSTVLDEIESMGEDGLSRIVEHIVTNHLDELADSLVNVGTFIELEQLILESQAHN